MSRVKVSGLIQAPPEQVFATISDIENLPNRDEHVRKVEFLSERKRGVGTRFRETRVDGKRVVETELVITECVENEGIRFVTDMGGTVWDTLYSCHPAGSPGGSTTRLEIALEARAHKLLPKLMNRFIMPMVRKGMEKHLASLRVSCESEA